MLPAKDFDRLMCINEFFAWALKWGVIVCFAGLLFFAATHAFGATYGLQDQAGNKLILHDAPCSIPFLKGWKKASFRYDGKDLTACWMASQGVVYVLDDSGDLTPVPTSAFTKLQEG